jgi:hypothetical protein
MNSTTAIVKRRFSRRLRAFSCTDDFETDAVILSKSKKINAAASIASGNPKVFVARPAAVDVRALTWRISET